MKKVKVFVEAGPIHIGMDANFDMIIGHGEYEEAEVLAGSHGEALLLAFRTLKPMGRTVRVFDGDVELFHDSKFDSRVFLVDFYGEMPYSEVVSKGSGFTKYQIETILGLAEDETVSFRMDSGEWYDVKRIK